MSSPSDDAYERGMRVRREVLGDAHVDAAVERTTDFTADFQELITALVWGEHLGAARASTGACAARSR